MPSEILPHHPGRAANSEPLLFTRLTTPLGPMIAMAERRGLVLLEFLDRPALTREIEACRTVSAMPWRQGTTTTCSKSSRNWRGISPET
jgi:hypothetical protein